MAEESRTPPISVEVAYAERDRQWLLRLDLPAHSTVEAALTEFRARLPELALPARFQVGIFGQVVPRTHRLRAGERVEIYRPLRDDPRDARRRLARAGGTMGRRR